MRSKIWLRKTKSETKWINILGLLTLHQLGFEDWARIGTWPAVLYPRGRATVCYWISKGSNVIFILDGRCCPFQVIFKILFSCRRNRYLGFIVIADMQWCAQSPDLYSVWPGWLQGTCLRSLVLGVGGVTHLSSYIPLLVSFSFTSDRRNCQIIDFLKLFLRLFKQYGNHECTALKISTNWPCLCNGTKSRNRIIISPQKLPSSQQPHLTPTLLRSPLSWFQTAW
jgi:hypothetical protein